VELRVMPLVIDLESLRTPDIVWPEPEENLLTKKKRRLDSSARSAAQGQAIAAKKPTRRYFWISVTSN
jgi:hypothetical protein